MSPAASQRCVTTRDWLTAIVVGFALSLSVWRELLTGGGIVGGDTYPYFFPQKQVMADGFAHGELPLWHDRTGLGYPLHAESQAGIFYPTNQILYRITDINTAYNISILIHYALAFVFAWRFCRSQTLSQPSALLAAMVFVYGWFPARLSLEWSIIGGVWFPFCLWLTDRLVRRPSRSAVCLLALAFATHLLAGHFTLAFITQLCCLSYALLAAGQGVFAHADTVKSINRIQAGTLVTAAIAVAICLAAVQLIPTLELRQLSQRDGSSSVFDPAYGHMPPVYLSQLVASWWFWHSSEIVQSRQMLHYPFLMSGSDTNQVEAHLYVGLIPLSLILCLLQPIVRSRLKATHWKIWLILSGIAVIYAFGWLVPVTKHLPGFGFFMGPGRYTIITTLGLAIISGLVLDALLRRKSGTTRWVITAIVAAITLPDLIASGSAPVCDAQIVPTPPISGLHDSWVAAALAKEAAPRLLAPGPNVCNLFGVSCVPQYLGLGPAEYFDSDALFDSAPADASAEFPSEVDVSRLRDRGVTHILTQEVVQKPSPSLEFVHAAPDSFLNRVWARGSADCFLYRLKSAPGRITVEPASALIRFSWAGQRPSQQELNVSLTEEAVVSVNDLMFPGWQASVDGKTVPAVSSRGFRRSVRVPAGDHTIAFEYHPASFVVGACVSILTLCAMGMFVVLPFRRRKKI
ncbi:MAG TPA: hypothetical protein PLR25_03000 [Planctomycetaceae bacterium]|nr:hypothetical protein [Planctomycetaceae bacterium]